MSQYLTTADNARIAYSVSGEGPFLFLVGAPVGLTGFAQLAAHLRDDFTVVTHDPRGIGLSAGAARGPVTPEILAQDLLTLIRHLTAGRVFLFGTSGGAVTGLELLRQDAGVVDLLVAHEPPLFSLLPDRGQTLAAADAAFARAADDPDAGMQAFMDLTEVLHSTRQEAPRPRPIPLPATSPEERAKNGFFLTQMAGPTVHYRPDSKRLIGSPLRIAAGEASIGQAARRASRALCEALGATLLDAPGNHLAPSLMPEPFARWLKGVLGQ